MLIRIIPGNVVDIMISQFGMAGTTQVIDRKAVEHELGWDVPFYIQYGKWVEGIVVHGDFGKSLWHQQSVLDEIK
jgi:peptide/nickel transport system permease protein